MRIIQVLSLTLFGMANATDYGVSGEYLKVSFRTNAGAAKHADVTHADANASDCSMGIFAEYLLKVAPGGAYAGTSIQDAAPALAARGDLAGACLSIDTTNFLSAFNSLVAADLGLFFFKETTNQYTVAQTSQTMCGGAVTKKTTGFLMVNGTDCGGAFTGSHQDDGLQMDGDGGWNATGKLFEGRHIAVQLQGPFSESECKTWDNSKISDYPIVLPMENKTTDSVTVQTASTAYHCQDFGTAITVGNHNILGYKYSATKGDFLFVMNMNTTGITYTNADMTCVPKESGATIYHSIKYSVGLRGGATSCIQSATTEGADGDTGKYFAITVNRAHLGTLPNPVDIPSPAPGTPGACSPASALKTTMAALLGLIAMLM